MMNNYNAIMSDTNANFIFVNSMKEAKSYMMRPGQTLWMMDNYKPAMYVKAVDTTGRVNFRAIGLTDLDVNSDEDEGEYATKTDLAKISAQLNELTQRIGNLVGELGGSAS